MDHCARQDRIDRGAPVTRPILARASTPDGPGGQLPRRGQRAIVDQEGAAGGIG